MSLFLTLQAALLTVQAERKSLFHARERMGRKENEREASSESFTDFSLSPFFSEAVLLENSKICFFAQQFAPLR